MPVRPPIRVPADCLVELNDPVAVAELRQSAAWPGGIGWVAAGMFHEPAHWNATSSGARTNSTPAGLSTTSATARIARTGRLVWAAGAVSVSMQRIHSRR